MAFFRSLLLTCLFTLVPLFIISCYENDPRPEKTELLAGSNTHGKTWRIIEIEVALGTLAPKDCIADNLNTYFPGGRHEVQEGLLKCNQNDDPASIGSWTLNDEQNILSIVIGDSIQHWSVDHLDHQNLQISSQFPDGLRTYSLYSSK